MKSNQHTILIVDNDANNINIAVQFLRAYSFHILIATTGENGLERASLASPDLILLDIQMAGIETCRRLKANPDTTKIPVICMTTITDIENKVRGLKAGAVDYVTKPIEEVELLTRVKTHMALRDFQLNPETEVQAWAKALEAEVQQHEKTRSEREMLLALLRTQTELLHTMVHDSLAKQKKNHTPIDQIAQRVCLLNTMVQQVKETLDKSAWLEDPIAMLKQRMQDVSAIAIELMASFPVGRQNLIGQNLMGQNGTQSPKQGRFTSMPVVEESPIFKLSTREYEVFQLIAQGKSNGEISNILTVLPSTIRTYRHRIARKLGLPGTNGLVKYAVEMELSANL